MLAHETQSPILPMCITARDGKVPTMFSRLAISCGELIMPEELELRKITPPLTAKPPGWL